MVTKIMGNKSTDLELKNSDKESIVLENIDGYENDTIVTLRVFRQGYTWIFLST